MFCTDRLTSALNAFLCRGATNLARQVPANPPSERIIGGAFQSPNPRHVGTANTLNPNPSPHELRKSRLAVAHQHAITVTCDAIVVGECAVNLLVEGSIIAELNATSLRTTRTLRSV